MFDDVPREERIPDEPLADVEDQHSGVEPEVQNLMDQYQLAESNPIIEVHEVSNTHHFQSPDDQDINSDDADRSGPHPGRDLTPDAVMVSPRSDQGMSPELIESEPAVTPELATCGGEEKAWDYYIDIAAVSDYLEDHHTKREDGDHPYLDGFSNEGSLGFDPPLELMGNFGYLSDSEGRMEMSVDYVGPEPLNCQRHVPQEHPPDVKVDTPDESEDLRGDTLVRSPHSDSSEFTDVQGNKPILFPGSQPNALRERC